MDKLATFGKIVINSVKEKWREYKGISGWKKHKEKFRKQYKHRLVQLSEISRADGKAYTGENIGISYRLWHICTQLRALNTTKESTEVPKGRCNNDKGNVPENALRGGLEKYWHEMIRNLTRVLAMIMQRKGFI